MLTIGSYVIYGTYGICLVKEIAKDMKVGTKRNDYFVLKPVAAPSSTVYIALTNKTMLEKTKAIPTYEEIHKLISEISESNIIWEENYKLRNDLFNEIITEGNRERILEMIKCIIKKKEELSLENKKLRLADETALRNAEKIINEEFSFVLGIPKEEVGDYIKNHLK